MKILSNHDYHDCNDVPSILFDRNCGCFKSIMRVNSSVEDSMAALWTKTRLSAILSKYKLDY